MASRSGHGGPRRQRAWLRCDGCGKEPETKSIALFVGIRHKHCTGTWRKRDPRNEVCRCANPESKKCPHWTTTRVRA